MAYSDCSPMWEGSGLFSYTNTSAEAVMVYKCPWSDRFTSKDNFLNGTHQANVHSDDSNLKAFSVEMEPLQDISDGVAGPKQAKLIVKFIPQNLWYKKGGVDGNVANWLVSADFAGEAYTLAGNKWKWDDTGELLGTTDPEHAVKVFPRADFNITGTWDTLDGTILDYIDGCIGYINETSYLGFAAEKLLFVGMNINQLPNSDLYTYNYHFRYNPETWNKFYRELTRSFVTVVNSSDITQTPYITAPFSDLTPDNW